MITVQQFKAGFPEFGSSVTYPPAQVAFWLDLGYSMLNASRWGRQLDFGVRLYAAHNLVLEGKAQAEAKAGGTPGQQVGPVSSKSVDKVSVGYDTSSGIELNAGHWNLSTYGTRFIRLARMFGAGGLQIGIGATPSGTGPAWPGPDTAPSPTGFG